MKTTHRSKVLALCCILLSFVNEGCNDDSRTGIDIDNRGIYTLKQPFQSDSHVEGKVEHVEFDSPSDGKTIPLYFEINGVGQSSLVFEIYGKEAMTYPLGYSLEPSTARIVFLQDGTWDGRVIQFENGAVNFSEINTRPRLMGDFNGYTLDEEQDTISISGTFILDK